MTHITYNDCFEAAAFERTGFRTVKDGIRYIGMECSECGSYIYEVYEDDADLFIGFEEVA